MKLRLRVKASNNAAPVALALVPGSALFAVTPFGFQKDFRSSLASSSSPLRLRSQKTFPHTTETSGVNSLFHLKSPFAER
jgi:hypothetical protein